MSFAAPLALWLSGLALAIIRKARMLFWAAIGGVLLIREGVSGRARSVQIPSAD